MSPIPPLLLHYYITERCNSRCGFCDIWRQPAGAPARLADVVKNLQDAARLGVRFVDFTGGEPLLHPELPQMLRQAKAAKLRTTLSTNGLLYPERSAELAGLVDFLHFSLDAATAKDHDRLRGTPAFSRVLDSIDRARLIGEKPDILFTALPENLHHLPALAEFSKKTGLILIVNPVFSHLEKRELSPADRTFIEHFAHLPFVYVNRAFQLLREQGGNRVVAPRCRVVDAVLVVSPENELILPCYHFEQARISLSTGLDMVWASRAHLEQRAKQGRWPECDGCNLNCYFDPSFSYKIDRFFVSSMAAKIKYGWDKYVRHPLVKRSGGLDQRPAAKIMVDILAQNSMPKGIR
jgi:MoaA/NifB/PqqE/SkfB family radical SAM enzyme